MENGVWEWDFWMCVIPWALASYYMYNGPFFQPMILTVCLLCPHTVVSCGAAMSDNSGGEGAAGREIERT